MITLETQHFTLGSGLGCDLQLDLPGISKVHCKIYYAGDSVLIEDLQTSEGTFVFYQGQYKRIKSAKIHMKTKVRLGSSIEMEMREIIKKFQEMLEKDKKDIVKKIKNRGLRRCRECGHVFAKDKIHCDCCGKVNDVAG